MRVYREFVKNKFFESGDHSKGRSLRTNRVKKTSNEKSENFKRYYAKIHLV